LGWNEKRRKMVDYLVKLGYLSSPEIIKAFERVPRHEFVPKEYRKMAYDDTPLPIGLGQTISAPSMIATMLEELQARRGDKILEIGTGSGYNAALLSEITGEGGMVYTIERIEELAIEAERRLRKLGYENVEVVIGDGTKGYEKCSPYDRIIVTAASPRIPKPLMEQLAEKGRMVIPVGSLEYQILNIVDKFKGEIRVYEKGACVFVPLIGEHGWKEAQLV